jgi:hypothetical protein
MEARFRGAIRKRKFPKVEGFGGGVNGACGGVRSGPAFETTLV